MVLIPFCSHSLLVGILSFGFCHIGVFSEKLVENVICKFGVPHAIYSDQGHNFESKVFQETCCLMGIMKTRTTPFNPKSDGLVERMNRHWCKLSQS